MFMDLPVLSADLFFGVLISLAVFFIIVLILAPMIPEKNRECYTRRFHYRDPYEEREETEIAGEEMYAIWIGRMQEIAACIRGKERIAIGREHCFSVWVWILLLGCIGAIVAGIFIWQFWILMIMCLYLFTDIYAHWRHGLPWTIGPPGT
jgi:hypothetical protein